VSELNEKNKKEKTKTIKNKKWKKKNLKTLEEKKRNLIVHKKETKKYRGIEYDLICLERNSGTKWVALETHFEFPNHLIYNLNESKLTGDDSLEDFLYHDSGIWDKYPIEYQWKKMDKIAKSEIDTLYKIHENIDNTIEKNIKHIKSIKNHLNVFIETIEGK